MSTIKVLDYVRAHRDDLVLLILLAHSGEYEMLKKYTNERDGFHLLQNAKKYGEQTKVYPPYDYPISVSETTGELIKLPYRLAGLIISGQKEMFTIRCGLPVQTKPEFDFSPEDKKTLDDFYLILIGGAATVADPIIKDSSEVAGGIARPQKRQKGG